MKLYEWEVWHTYSCYSENHIEDLDQLSRYLVEKNFALCSMHKNGRTYWTVKNKVQSGHTEFSYAEDRENVELIPDEGSIVDTTETSLECWIHAVKLRREEEKLFSDVSKLPPEYIRLFLGQYDFIRNDTITSCYPILKIFQTGIVLLSFRFIGPSRPVDLEEFINDVVNIFRHNFSEVFVSPALSRFAPSASIYSLGELKSFKARRLLNKVEKLHSAEVNNLTYLEEVEEEVLQYEKAPLTKYNDEDDDSLASIASTVFGTLDFLMTYPTTGIKHIFLGRKRRLNLHSYWLARPHIYIVKHQNQKQLASENEKYHKEAFKKIIQRVSHAHRNSPEPLPKSSRLFDDYNSYISSHLTLWVWSLSGIKTEKTYNHVNRNRENLIYSPQITVEMLDYSYILYKKLLSKASRLENTNSIIQARLDLAAFKNEISEVSPFGETRDLLNQGLNSMGIERLQNSINEHLEIKSSQMSMNENRISERVNRGLTILFGIIATPPLATDVLQPIFETAGIQNLFPPHFYKLITIAISIVLVWSIVTVILYSSSSKRKSKK